MQLKDYEEELSIPEVKIRETIFFGVFLYVNLRGLTFSLTF